MYCHQRMMSLEKVMLIYEITSIGLIILLLSLLRLKSWNGELLLDLNIE